MAARHEFKAGDSTFYIRRFDPFLALKILGDLQKKFLGPLASLAEGQDKKQPEEVRMKYMMESIDKVSRSLDGDTLVDLSKKLLNPDYISVVIGSEPAAKLDEAMLNRSTDNLGDVVSLIIEVVKVNYTEVFTRGKALIGQAQSNMESQ